MTLNYNHKPTSITNNHYKKMLSLPFKNILYYNG